MTGLLSWFKKNSLFIATAAVPFLLYADVKMVLTWPLVTGMNRYYFRPEAPGMGQGDSRLSQGIVELLALVIKEDR